VFERYTESARRVIFYARWWALNRKATQIETSDLILGAAQEARREDSPLQWMNLNYQQMVALFAEGVVCVAAPEAKDLPLSSSSKRALAYAAMETDLDWRYSLEVYHIVRGVLRNGDPVAKTTVEATGCTLKGMREGSREANRNITDARRQLKLKTGLQLLKIRASLIPWYIRYGLLLAVIVAAILYLRSQN